MSKRPNTPRSTPRPAPNDAAMREKGFAPFLRAEHINGGDFEWFALTGYNVPATDARGPFIKVELENERKEQFVVGVREGTPDHRRLFHAFWSADYRDWKRGAVKMIVTPGTKNPDAKFVNIGEADSRPPLWD